MRRYVRSRWLSLVLGGLIVLLAPWLSASTDANQLARGEVQATLRVTASGSNYPSTPADRGGSINSIVDDDINTWWYGELTPTVPLRFSLIPEEPLNLTKIILENGEDREPVDAQLEVKAGGNSKFTTVTQVTNAPSRQPLEMKVPIAYQHGVSDIRLTITKTRQLDGLVRIQELRLFERLP